MADPVAPAMKPRRVARNLNPQMVVERALAGPVGEILSRS